MSLGIILLGVIAAVIIAVVALRANERAVTNYLATGTTRRSKPAGGVRVRELRRLDLEGELLESDPRALVPYQGAGLSPYPGGQIVPYQPVVHIGAQLPPATAGGAGWELTRQTPSRAPTVAADFAVPALQASMTALAAGIAAGLLAWGLGWSWRVPVVVTGLALAGAWLWRLNVVTGLLWRIETVLQRDVNGDGIAGVPIQQKGFALVNPADARAEAARAQQKDAGDERRAELLDFTRRCYTLGTGVRAHDANNLGPARDRYLRLRGTLMQLGIAKWKDPDKTKAGWVLTVDEVTAVGIIMEHVA